LVAPATPARAPTRSLSRGRTGVTLLLVVGGIIATGFATAFQWLLAAHGLPA